MFNNNLVLLAIPVALGIALWAHISCWNGNNRVHHSLRTDQYSVAVTLGFARVEAAPSLALDMEMENHCHLYGLYIALIQLSTPDNRHYIIDPLADIDLQPLGKIFSDPARQTILHDADFDRRAAAQVYGWKLHGIFDTKIAAQLCGHRKFGLGNLLAEYFNVTANKRFQTMNWMKRPIPEEALSYAVGDTAYLHALRDRLSARLSNSRTAWRRRIRLCGTPGNAAPESPLHHRINAVRC